MLGYVRKVQIMLRRNNVSLPTYSPHMICTSYDCPSPKWKIGKPTCLHNPTCNLDVISICHRSSGFNSFHRSEDILTIPQSMYLIV